MQTCVQRLHLLTHSLQDVALSSSLCNKSNTLEKVFSLGKSSLPDPEGVDLTLLDPDLDPVAVKLTKGSAYKPISN